jgi:hypothetical protein
MLLKRSVRQTRFMMPRLNVLVSAAAAAVASCAAACLPPAFLGVEAPGEGFNPSTWMLDISAVGSEARLGVDFAAVYQDSSLRT